MKNRKEKSSNAAGAVLYKTYGQIHVSEAQFACIPSKTKLGSRRQTCETCSQHFQKGKLNHGN